MFDQSETACVMAGVAAIGAIWYASRPMYLPYGPSECSARKADVVSARAANEGMEEVVEENVESMDSLFESSETTEPDTSTAGLMPAQALNRKQHSLNVEMEKPHNSKFLGTTVAVVGKCLEPVAKPVVPDSFRECMFYKPHTLDEE